MSTSTGLFRPLFPSEVAVVEGDPSRSDLDGVLYPDEAVMIARAVPVRRREFTAGRVFARRALGALGLPTGPILADENRAPQWPADAVGTISHTRRWCVAAVARRTDLRSLGADVEEDAPLEPELWRLVCSPAEVEHLKTLGDAGLWAKLVFGAKECAYKAVYPLCHKVFGFSGMTVRVAVESETAGREAGNFRAELTIDVGPFAAGDRFEGRFRRDNGMWATALTLPR